MDCEQYQEALSAAAIGEERGAEVQAFRLHLAICECCRRELARRREFLGSLDQHLQTQFETAPSGDFNARLRRRIELETTRAPGSIIQWLPVFAGAAVLAVVIALFHFHHQGAARLGNSNTFPAVPSAEHVAPQLTPLENSSVPPQESAVARVTPAELPVLHPVAVGRPSPELKVRIDHRELYAVVRLAQAVADGRVNTTALLDSQPLPDEAVAAKPLEIPPLELKPMEDPAPESGTAER